MTEERKTEQKPWSPQVDREPLFNAFENPQSRNSELRDPVALMDEDAEDDTLEEEEPAVTQAPSSEVAKVTNEPK